MENIILPDFINAQDIDKNIRLSGESEIRSTLDYSRFYFIRGNRPISKYHLKLIINSMQEKAEPKPIMVCYTRDRHLAILDGQHSFIARKCLGLKIPYMVVESDIETMKRLNLGAKNWKGIDFANLYSSLGEKNYETYLWFRKKYGFAHAQALRLLFGRSPSGYKSTSDFNKGIFEINNLAEAIDYADKIIEIQEYYKGAKRKHFIDAMCYLFNLPFFSFDRFMRKLKYLSSEIKDCATMKQYIEIIERLYNYQEKKENRERLQEL